MEAASTSETWVNLYQTKRRSNPEDCHLPLIPLTSEAANTSETSVNFYHTTRRNNPEDSNIHTLMYECNNSVIKTPFLA
jgi:hypothetical protein